MALQQPTSPPESTSSDMANTPTRRAGSLSEAGFVQAAQVLTSKDRPYHRLMLSLEGPQGSGKSEFADSAPGPGAHIVLDRGIDSVLNNPEPPATRSPNFLYKVCRVPKASQFASQKQYLEYWKLYFTTLLDALDSPESRTVVIDGDPDSWELQRLAEFGRLTKVPPLMYDQVNAARRALYARCYDSGKIVIATSRVRKVYADKTNPATGAVMLKDNGDPVREWTGEYEKEGFRDAGFVWTIRCATRYEPDQGFGLRILECKVNKAVEGQELWGEECTFAGLVSLAYPHIPLSAWGY
jgi:hypothetical protein